MKKGILIAASLSLLATSVCAKNIDVRESDLTASPFSKSSPIFEDDFETKKKQNTASTSEASENTQEAESWGAWAYNKAWDAGKYIVENGARVATGAIGVAYGTPYLNPVVNAAGEAADWGVSGAVTAATGCYPLGWVAGKGAKTATLAAGYHVAPTVAGTAGYYAPEIVTGVYNAGKAVYNLATGS